MEKTFQVKDEFINSRLDRWFKRVISDVPQSFIEKNLRKGKIKVNNKKQKSSYKLKKNDLVIVYDINFPNITLKKSLSYYKPSKRELHHSSSLFISLKAFQLSSNFCRSS